VTRASDPRRLAGRHRVQSGEVELVPDEANPAGWLVVVNGLDASYVDLDDPTWLEFEYVRWIGDALDLAALPGAPLRVAHLGGGGGTLPRYVAATRPGSAQLVLEIDPDLLALADAAFGLAALPGVRLVAADARAGLAAEPAGSFDAVVRDTFEVDRVPAHLAGPGFAAEVGRALAPGGIYLANAPAGVDLAAARGEAADAAESFDHVALLVDPVHLRGRRFGNVVLAASRRPLPLDALSRRLAGGIARARVIEVC
jgi:spermidine synthase